MQFLPLEMVKNERKAGRMELLAPFAPEEVIKVRSFHKSMWGYYHETSLVELPALAAWAGVGRVFVKDESARFELNSFKGLGGSYAVASYLARKLGISGQKFTFDELTSEEASNKLGKIVFATATDGNHGRGIAWAAKIFGFESVVFLPRGSAMERVEAIRKEGAAVKVTELNYDDTVRLLAKEAQANGWVVCRILRGKAMSRYL